jgi:signal transduction histidine kinase
MDTKRTGPEWIDMKSLCQSLLVDHSDRAQGQHVTIDLALPAEPASVIGYRDLLRGALDRLVRRALKAMPGGGVLTLRLRRDQHIVLECSDTGEAVGTTPSRTTRALVEAHGGRLWRRSLHDGGTCFVVELPVAGPNKLVAA